MTNVMEEDNYLAHYGIIRRSGRYPWGSGGNSEQRSRSFLDYIKELLGFGMSYSEIAQGVGMTTTQLRETNSLAKAALKQAQVTRAQRLRDKGYTHESIAQIMGLKGESSVRALLKPGELEKANIVMNVSNMLREEMQTPGKPYLDVGTGVERHIGISREKLGTAIAILKDEGYEVHTVPIRQLGTGMITKTKVLAPPGTEYRDITNNMDKLGSIVKWSEDGGRSLLGVEPPKSIDSSRVAIRYKEDGGDQADGVVYVRPGVDDITLDGRNYAQVRIAVDGSHYIKGMAMYKDDLPAGVDLMFNTNKSDTGNKLDAMKPLKTDEKGNIDPDNPFGSAISRQIFKKDAHGNTVLDADGNPIPSSVMNLVNEAGKWETWSKDLSSQMLSKQPHPFAKERLDKTFEKRRETLDEIMELTNPAVKRKLLESYADETDSAAWLMKAASSPRTANYVILPVNSMKSTEVYAPKFKDGERVVLIRHPHGGIFEIPELTVNNRHPEAKKLLGPDAPDAIGINHEVAKQLSGADFDGDTVLVVPNNNRKIKTAAPLKQLKDFDPQRQYKAYEGMPRMSPSAKQHQMGLVSNLITDMSIQKAPLDEIARAVKHSMVVIDAEKHHLNYKQSAIDNGIPQLMEKYQGKKRGGAATLISRRKQTIDVPERVPRSGKRGGPIDPKTGKLVYDYTNAEYVDRRTGKTVKKTTKVNAILETDDVRKLSSGTPIEEVYANHSNRLKGLANQARKAAVNTQDIPYSPSARKIYDAEVKSLNSKLNLALMNRPRERQAQLIAGATYDARRRANPDMDASEEKKLKAQALEAARTRVGAGKQKIRFTPREWEAVQNGAISKSKLGDILDNADLDEVKKLAMPKVRPLMSSSKIAKAKRLAAAGKTQAEIAEALGVGLTTLKEGLK